MSHSIQRCLTAIAEPSRFRIVELLRSGPLPVGKIVDDLGMSQPHVSRHLRLLAEAEVVDASKRAQQRIYRIRPETMQGLSDWTQQFAGLWSERMDRLGSFLDEANSEDSERG